MTYQVGAAGHMQAHTDLVAAVNAQLVRFGMPGDLPTRSLGDEGHLDDTNAIIAALSNIETAAGQTFTIGLPPTRNLGDTGHTDDHDLLAACAIEAASWPAWNDATGGTITEIDNYNGSGERWRVHRFDSSGTLNVTVAVHPFRALIVGGGGGAGNGAADRGPGGGGGGGVWDSTLSIPVGSHAVTVGATNHAQNGGASSIGAYQSVNGGYRGGDGNTGGNVKNGGDSGEPTRHTGGRNSSSSWDGGGGAGAGGNGGDARPPGPGRTSTITGSSTSWGAGGWGGKGVPPREYTNGQTGVVIVAYRIG